MTTAIELFGSAHLHVAVFVAALLGCCAPVQGHNTQPGLGDTIYLTYGGAPGIISVTHELGEACTVTAQARQLGEPPEIMVSLRNLSTQPALDVTLQVIPNLHLRGPFFRTVVVNLTWRATGLKTDGIIDPQCNGVGDLNFNVVINEPNGVCGYADGKYAATAPGAFTLCLQGLLANLSGNNPWTWVCLGNPSVAGSTNAYCETLASSYQDLWYNPNESGWGMSIMQHHSTAFNTIYTYDAAGMPTWFVMSNCAMSQNGCAGDIYKVSGGTPPAVPWSDASKAVARVGSGSLSFADSGNATFNFNIDGQQGSKSIVRQLFGATTTPPFVDYTDLWWASPAGSESGWGLAISQQYQMLFVTWYTYDGSGNPLWYVASSCPLLGDSGCTGDLYQVSGGSPLITTWSGLNKVISKIGFVTLSFTDDSNGIMSYSINGISGSKSITRQSF